MIVFNTGLMFFVSETEKVTRDRMVM